MARDPAGHRCRQYRGPRRAGVLTGKLIEWLKAKEIYPGLECSDCEQEALKGRGDFPCPVCPMLHLEPLRPENQDALSLYRIVATQVGMDFHLAPVLLVRLLEDRSLEDMVDVMERLDLIYASMRRIAESQRQA